MSDQPEPLTRMQEKVLAFFKKAILKGGAPPTYRELCDHFGWLSSAAARDHLHALVTKGYLRREPGHAARNYRLATAPVPKDIAKVPLVRRFLRDDDVFAETNREGEFSAPSDWLPARGRCFAMRVADDGIREAALLGGDVLVVRAARSVKHGALAVTVEGKQLGVRKIGELNESERYHIIGVAVGVMRRLRWAWP